MKIYYINIKFNNQSPEFRAVIALSDKLQTCDPIMVKLVTTIVSKVDPVSENSPASFSAQIDGPNKPKKVYLHHMGMFESIQVKDK